jgi:hypothetical protein
MGPWEVPVRTLLVLVALAFPLTASAKGPVIELEGETLYVRPPMPEVMVVISRKNLDAGYDLELRESFLDQIVRSVDGGPF